MKYTENDLQLGDKLLCTKSEIDHWISGKMYELKLNNLGVLEVKDEDGDEAYSIYLLECLNKEWDLVEFELIKGENNMQEFKVGDLVEVIENKSGAYKNKFERFKAGDKAVVTDVLGSNIRIGNDRFGNVIGIKEVKKVEQKPELTEYEEELVLRLAEKIKEKDMLERNMNNLMTEIQYREELATKTEQDIEEKQKEIKETYKKLLIK